MQTKPGATGLRPVAPPRARRWPAEWEPQSAVLMCWPRPSSGFDRESENRAGDCLLEIAACISRHETVLMTLPACRMTHETLIETLIHHSGNPDRIRWIPIAANDIWFRDYGPLTVFEGERPILLDFSFNGWGGKYPHEDDDRATRRLWQAGSFGPVALESHPWVLEGGSVDGDGNGTLLTTPQCLLHPSRGHPDCSPVEEMLNRTLGIQRVLWLEAVVIPGDDTDGHVDTLARFASSTTLVYQGGSGFPDTKLREQFTRMGKHLARFRRPDGQPYDLVELPSPGRLTNLSDHPLPATYANFLIVNDALLVPQYGVASDSEVCRVLGEVFPDRTLYPIDARPLIQQYGSIHCATLQLPWGVVPA
ncbi:MAG: agmatine deiminase family protein [Gammaproteobacteria bacterium]